MKILAVFLDCFVILDNYLMKGLLASATLYGEFMEKYVYSESPVENKINYKHAEKGFFVYDAGSIISVWGWQLTYSLMVPFIMFVEVFFIAWSSLADQHCNLYLCISV